MDSYLLSGKKLEVIQHQTKEKREKTEAKFNNLYVKNFELGTTDEQLREMFTEFGDIESVFIAKDAEGMPKDHGFVCFKQPEDALRAVEAMNKKPLGEGKFLLVNQHISKKTNEMYGDKKTSPIS